jgi:rhodanese-related sulfurtransferase
LESSRRKEMTPSTMPSHPLLKPGIECFGAVLGVSCILVVLDPSRLTKTFVATDNTAAISAPPFLELEIGDVLRLRHRGDVAIIDTRSRQDYAAGHIPGAINRPLVGGNDKFRANELPASSNIIFYGGDGVERALMNPPFEWKGVSVMLFRGGANEWRRDGLPLDGDSSK